MAVEAGPWQPLAFCLQPDQAMSTIGVHRIIERQATLRANQIALMADRITLTYRELNQRANAVARELIAGGLRRGTQVIVRQERSPELAILLLAILKAGAAYTWIDQLRDSFGKYGLSVIENGSTRPLRIDAARLLAAAKSAPNLPIVTRAEDIACGLPGPDGMPGVLVPHATIAALDTHLVPGQSLWLGDATALDLWLPLMAGATVAVDAAPAQGVAA